MPHNLDKLIVERFRGLRNLELADLGRVNLFVGPNNSGKTSVLEAVATFCQPLDPMAWLDAARRREVKSSREPLLDVLKWLFPQTSQSHTGEFYTGETRVVGAGRFPLLKSGARYGEIRGEPDGGSSDSSDDEGWGEEDDGAQEEQDSYTGDARRGCELDLTAVVRIEGGAEERSESFELWEGERFVRRKEAVGPSLPVAALSPFSHRVDQIQVGYFSEAVSRGETDAVLEMVRLLDPGIVGLQILARKGIRPALHVQHEKVGLSPLSAFGDGVRRSLMMALNLIAARSGVLLIDEIETSIHKSALSHVFGWLVHACATHEVQLFATTHSLDAVDAILTADQVDLTDVVGYHLAATGETTSVKRYGGELLHRLRHERGLDVR